MCDLIFNTIICVKGGKIKNKIIRVVFFPNRKSPLNLKQKEYFVEAVNYNIAHERAINCLNEDMSNLGKKIRSTSKQLLRYYDKVAMCEINLIR